MTRSRQTLERDLPVLVRYIAEQQSQNENRSRKKNEAEILADALMRISADYAKQIKSEQNGWICGTHNNVIGQTLTAAIETQYSRADCRRLIDDCCAQKGTMEPAGRKRMLLQLLQMRPGMIVHASEGWIQKTPSGEA